MPLLMDEFRHTIGGPKAFMPATNWHSCGTFFFGLFLRLQFDLRFDFDNPLIQLLSVQGLFKNDYRYNRHQAPCDVRFPPFTDADAYAHTKKWFAKSRDDGLGQRKGIVGSKCVPPALGPSPLTLEPLNYWLINDLKSSKILAYYLCDTLKKHSANPLTTARRTCIELGSGCGLCGLTMASLGIDSMMTDLEAVVDDVLRGNVSRNVWIIRQSSPAPAQIKVAPLDWVTFSSGERDTDSEFLSSYDYVLASDCVYNMALLGPLLDCMQMLSSAGSTVLVALERRDDDVVERFVLVAREKGFEVKQVPKKLLRLKEVGNEDVEIWKLRRKRRWFVYFHEILFII